MRFLPLTICFLTASAIPAQPPAFEVASVKLNKGCSSARMGRPPSPGRVNILCTPVRDLIEPAYSIFANGQTFNPRQIQIVGAPSWIDSDRYDIDAKAADGAGFGQMAGPMLQALLEDRFKLKVHRETRELPVYELTVAKSGLRLKPLAQGSCTPLDMNHLPAPPAPGEPPPNFCGRQEMKSHGPDRTWFLHGITIANFAEGILSERLERPVIDKTGVEGLFDIHLEYTPDTAGPPADNAGPSLVTALQEQLGLKASPDKGPVEVLVVDHIEKPSEN